MKRRPSSRTYMALSAAAVLLATALAIPATASAQSDLTPPVVKITQAPPNPSGKREATFAFTATDNLTPAIDLEFQCRLDPQKAAPGTDPLDLWLDCLSPQFFTGLAPGEHTFEVQALDQEENISTPATYTWVVGQATTCADASGKIDADADAWFEEKSPIEGHGDDSALKVMSKAPGENSRAAVRFPLPQPPAGCVLQSASLKLYSDSAPSVPGKLQALRLTSAWGENNIAWGNQPATAGPAAEAPSAMGYVTWDVTAQVQAGASHGFLIRHATENDLAGAEEGFFSKEKLESMPELVLTYAGAAAGGGGGGATPVPPVVQPPTAPVTPVTPGTAPRPTAKPLAASRAQLTAALRADLRRAATTLRRFGLAKLLRKKGANVNGVHALIPGRVQIATVFGGKRVVVLVGTRSFARAGKATLRLKLTKKGRQVLKRKRSAKFTLRGSFTNRAAVVRASGPKVTVKRKGRR